LAKENKKHSEKNIGNKIMRNIIKKIIKKIIFSLKLRPPSYPYISGDTLRLITKKRYEKHKKISIEKIKKGDIIFVESPLLGEFYEKIVKNLKNPIILIVTNGDENFNESSSYIFDHPMIYYAFVQNILFKHNKIQAIPIGLENLKYLENGIIFDFLKYKTIRRKKCKILVNFSISTNPLEREKAFNIFEKLDYSLCFSNKKPVPVYRKIASNYQYVLSPPGNGFDCHRTWEAIILNSIPIVKENVFFTYFPDLPVLALRRWEDIYAFTKNDLEAYYKDNYHKIINCPYLYYKYWKIQILRKKEKLRLEQR